MNPEDLERSALLAAKLAGCDCDCDVELEQHDGIYHAHIRHDTWCHLMNRRRSPCNGRETWVRRV